MSTQTAPPTLSDTQKILALLEGMNQRMVRLEASVARLDVVVGQGPGFVAGLTDTVDGVMGGLSARGVDVDARLHSALVLAEKLTEPAVLETVGRLVERLDTVEQSVELAAQAPAVVAGVADTVDGVMADLADQGVDLHQRLGAALKAAEALTRPQTLAALEKLAASTDKLEQAIELADALPGAVAGVTDTVDGVMGDLAARGIDVDARMVAGLSTLEKLTRPEMLATLEKLADQSDKLEQALELAEAAPGMIAGVADTIDGVIARAAGRGVDLDQRLTLLLQAAEDLTDPSLLTLLTTLTQRAPQLARALEVVIESGVLDDDAVEIVGAAGTAMVETRSAGASPMGAFGALRAMSDPDVQRAVGFGLELARRFGARIHSPS